MTEQHAVGMQRTLRISGGAGGEDDDGRIIRAGWYVGELRRCAFDGLPERPCAGGWSTAGDIDALEIGQPVANAGQFLKADGIRHDSLSTAVGETEFERILAKQS